MARVYLSLCGHLDAISMRLLRFLGLCRCCNMCSFSVVQRSHILLPGLYFCVFDNIFQFTAVLVMLWSHMCLDRVVLLRFESDLKD